MTNLLCMKLISCAYLSLGNSLILILISNNQVIKGKCKVVYGQEPPSGESTTTECGQLPGQLSTTCSNNRSSPMREIHLYKLMDGPITVERP